MFSLTTAIGARRFASGNMAAPVRERRIILILWGATIAMIYAVIYLNKQLDLISDDAALWSVQIAPAFLALGAIYRSRQPLLFGTFLVISFSSFAIIFGTNFFAFFQLGVDALRNSLNAIETQYGAAGGPLRLVLAVGLVSMMFSPVFIVPMIMLQVCPLEALTKRMIFLAGGLVAQIALNTLSIYGATLRALLTAPPT